MDDRPVEDLARERRALRLFDAAADVSEDERETWIVRETAGDDDLAARIRSLLAADARAALRTGGGLETVEEGPPPARIGAYRLTGLIGRGGMGAVYRGEREAGDFEHRVAIKLIRASLAGDALRERFRRERQTLAGLSHPNIAQLFDGGEVDGTPYIIMELVDGEPIDAWTAARDAPLDQRVHLFETVCRAVAFAHRSLIVHRDLTPSNVLVTPDGTPKLIDFGIAKPSDAGEIEGERPSLAGLSLTPGFAAPERMTSARVTTAADIYSLGKVLDVLAPDADRDLRAIAAYATVADPAGRYPTADALAADVAAWRAGLPVAARGGGWRYRVARLVARNKLASGLAAGAVIALVAALVLTLTAYARAETARRAEAARFADLRDLAGFMLFDLNGSLSRVVGTAKARLEVTNRAQRYLGGLAASPTAEPALKLEAARGFIALALVQGVPTQPNLGFYEQARANLDAAIRLARAVGSANPTTGALVTRALALRSMIEAQADNDLPGADATLRQAAALLGKTPATDRERTWFMARSELRRSQLDLASLHQDPAAILRAADALGAEVEQWPAPLRGSREAELDRAHAAHGRGIHRYAVDRLDEAVTFYQQAERRFAALERATPNDPVVGYIRAYNAYLGTGAAISTPGRMREAATFQAVARATIDRLRAIEPEDRLVLALAGAIGGAEAQALSAGGRHAEALVLQTRNVELYRELVRRRPRPANANRLVIAHITLAKIAHDAGRRDVACATYPTIEREMAALDRSGALIAYIAAYRPRVATNIANCRSAAALIAM